MISSLACTNNSFSFLNCDQDGPPPSQRPKIDTSTDQSYHSPSHVFHTRPSSSRTSSFKQSSHFSSSDYDQPSHGLPPSKHPRLVTAPSSPLTTLHGPTSTVVLHTAGPHRDPGYESTSTAASPSVAPPPPPATTASPCMQRYVTYLKQLYISTKTPVYDKESTLLYFKAKEFINIALVHKNVKTMTENDKQVMIMDRLHGHVDAIQKKKTKLSLNDVCKGETGDVAHCVLVEGAPGVGKTTFAFELCKQWARGEILQEWGVVVIIKLRDQRTRTAQTINDLLYHPNPNYHQAVTELIEQDGKGMLLILDGYDELTTKQRKSGSVIEWLMCKKLLYRATLMVTSRPLATRTLHSDFLHSIDQHIEVLGFTEGDIKAFIDSACGDNPELVEDFKEYLSCHPFSSSLMFNPLQCAIVTDLYRSHWQRGDRGFAPKTLTELYTGLVHTLLLRYLTHHPVHKDRDWRLRDMSDLPEDVKQQLKSVTALAAKGIEKQQYVFDEEDDNVPSETLGLMQREEELTAGIGRSSSHNFLHLTLQEYLAAVHYSQQCDSPEQLTQLLTRDDLFPLSSFLRHYGKKTKNIIHWPVALFLAGRTQLSGVPLDHLKAGLHDASVDVSLLHLLYETQCPQLIQSTLVTSRKYISVHGRSALDWFVIGYCIANSTSSWRIEKKANDVLKYFNNLTMGLELAPQDVNGVGKIVSLNFSGSWSGNVKILSKLQSFTKKVTVIMINSENNALLQNVMNYKGLATVKIVFDCYPLLEELCIGYAEINSCFITQLDNLHTLSLNWCFLSNEATTSLIHYLQSPNSRLMHKLFFTDVFFCTADRTYEFSSFELLETNGKYSLKAKGSSFAINHWLLYIPSYANLMTELNLNVTEQDSSPDETLEGISFNNLHTLSLTKCELSSESTSSLIHSLQSHNSGRLHRLSFSDCTFSTTDHTYKFSSFKLLETNGKYSLKAEGSSFAINHWLLYIPFYANLMTELNLNVTEQDSSPDETLEGISLNNLHTLSLTKCQLSIKTTSSLIHSLQSEHCKLNKLTLQYCTIPSTDSTIPFIDDFSFSEVQHGKISLSATGSCSAINHWLSLLSSYSVQLTELILSITKQEADETLEGIGLFSHMLEILNFNSTCFKFSFPLFFELRQNNLHTLSLTKCELSNEATSSLIHFHQSPNSRLLHKLSFSDCKLSTTDHTYQFSSFELLESNGTYSLKAEGSSFAINHWLLYIPSYANLMTELNLNVTEQDSSPDETLEGISFNNLHTLSLTKCELSSESTSSLIHSLQSHNSGRLHRLSFSDCTFSTTDHTYKFSSFKLLETNGKYSLKAEGSSFAINHWLLYIPFYANLMTELNLNVTEQDSSPDETLEGISLKNLHTLSLSNCELNSEATSSLIHSLQSPNSRLLKGLLFRNCTFSSADHTYCFTVLELLETNGKYFMEAKGSSFAINHWLLQLSSYTKIKLTESILEIEQQNSSSNETLENISFFCDVLEILRINGNLRSVIFPQFIRQQQNNLHTLSLKNCNFTSEDTSSLIHSLQSPHCRLHKLVLYCCTIPTTDHTLLITAIVSSTTITHLLFIGNDIDTQSLTALVSGLKQNRTMEELAINNGYYSANFTEEQLQLLIKGVDSSAVKKFWLYIDYKKLLSDCPLSRDDVVIEWYDYPDDVYKKW